MSEKTYEERVLETYYAAVNRRDRAISLLDKRVKFENMLLDIAKKSGCTETRERVIEALSEFQKLMKDEFY